MKKFTDPRNKIDPPKKNTPSRKIGEHTPGPWQVGFSDGSGRDDHGYSITAGDHPAIQDISNVVTVVLSGRDNWGSVMGVDNEANANLISAAPDLLEAARITVLNFERSDASDNFLGDDEHEAWTALSKAITKAEGNS